MCEEGSESKFVSEEGLNVFWTMPRTNLTPATLRNIKTTQQHFNDCSGPLITLSLLLGPLKVQIKKNINPHDSMIYSFI